MKCLIIAAGKGSRLKAKGDIKPLVHILGKPLIERVIQCAVAAGAGEIYVVTGYKGAKVRNFLDTIASQNNIPIRHVINHEWKKGNGLSVLKAKEHLKEKFILMMGDHLVDPALLNNLIMQRISDDEVMLGVDRCTENPLVNMTDVTKAVINNGRISNIGKELTSYNGFDTGIFLCSPAIFQGIEKSISEHGDTSLSGGVRCLAQQGKLRAFDIGGKFWIDVDDPQSLEKAENTLLKELRGKQTDGPVSRYLNRPVSTRISRHLVGFPITPNQISILSFFLSMLAAGLFFIGSYAALLAGGVLAQCASIIDGCDGEIARLKFQESSFGGWLDAVLDRYADGFLLFGMTWHAWLINTQWVCLFAGFMAIMGSFMVSYTADKYDKRMRGRFGKGFRIGRDIRVFLIFLGALINQVLWSLAVIATIMNAETFRRIYVCRTVK